MEEFLEFLDDTTDVIEIPQYSTTEATTTFGIGSTTFINTTIQVQETKTTGYSDYGPKTTTQFSTTSKEEITREEIPFKQIKVIKQARSQMKVSDFLHEPFASNTQDEDLGPGLYFILSTFTFIVIYLNLLLCKEK